HEGALSTGGQDVRPTSAGVPSGAGGGEGGEHGHARGEPVAQEEAQVPDVMESGWTTWREDGA
ncbi:MAG: hypothetical protein K2Q09_10245, partial [Phycisphaerales bacterium]|nr:hypothetical protein [Phycisphaerales bacterium]